MPTNASAEAIRTIDHFVPHVSTVPANLGQTVGLYLRERVAPLAQAKPVAQRPVVLCIHGGFLPGAVAYDLQFRDYSVMAALARAGYDVFAMTHTGYGTSPKPMMDDPTNVAAEHQHLLIPHVLKEPTKPRYPFKLVSSQTEFDEIHSVVEFIKALRGVDKMHMFGWSTGTPRIGGYAVLHPENVESIVFAAPAPFFPSDTPPSPMPEPGAPMILQSYDFLMKQRWLDDVRCEGQIEHADIRDAMWKELMQHDGLGAQWGAEGIGIMRAPNRMNYGWRVNAAKIKTPVLTLLGEFDNYQNRLDSGKVMTAERRVFIKVKCASHFLPYERGRHVMLRTALDWFRHASVEGASTGEFTADVDGKLSEGA